MPDPVHIISEKTGKPAWFDLQNVAAYAQWRDWKLANCLLEPQDLCVPVSDAYQLSSIEVAEMSKRLRTMNMVIYQITKGEIEGKQLVRELGMRFALRELDNNLCSDEDSITSLQVVEGGRHKNYIPYTNRGLSWHTDGYYNAPDRQIHAIVMHCVRDAASGGENLLLDHEMAYIHLRDHNPAYISALMHDQAMTIPPNTEEGAERGATTGPVFSVHQETGSLHMRFSARKRNIEWRDDPLTMEAIDCLNAFLASNTPYIIHYRLKPGEGIISNNVLHNRTAFNDTAEQKRLLYRARYFDRVGETGFEAIKIEVK